MSKSKITPPGTYPEIDDIKQDLSSLRQNVVELTKHIQKDGKAQSREIKHKALEQYQQFKSSAKDQFKEMESHIKEKPGQSVAIAFAAGLVASLLLGRR